jgi:hypothetical protein
LAIETPVLDRLGHMLGLDDRLLGQIGNCPGDLKQPNKALLYVEHEFEAFVPRVIVGWEALAAIGV